MKGWSRIKSKMVLGRILEDIYIYIILYSNTCRIVCIGGVCVREREKKTRTKCNVM